MTLSLGPLKHAPRPEEPHRSKRAVRETEDVPRAFRLQERFDYLAYISIRKLLEQIALREVPIVELGRGLDFLRELETLGFVDLHYKDEIPQSCTLAREAFDDIKPGLRRSSHPPRGR